MDTTMNVTARTWKNEIVSLSSHEIEMVSGGKSVVATWISKITDWFSGGGGPAPSAPSGGISITGSELVQLQHDCVTAGGNFSVTGSTQFGGGSYVFVSGSGETSYITIKCTQP